MQGVNLCKEVLENAIGVHETCEKCGMETQPLDAVAVQAMKELLQYRKIGTVEECREAVEKQKSKKPDYEGDGLSDGQLVYDTWICPPCGQHYEVDCDRYDYCPNCGQILDWSGADAEH